MTKKRKSSLTVNLKAKYVLNEITDDEPTNNTYGYQQCQSVKAELPNFSQFVHTKHIQRKEVKNGD